MGNVNRYWIIASFIFVIIFPGIPVWWKTTEVYRTDVDFSGINYWVDTEGKLDHSIELNIVFLVKQERSLEIINTEKFSEDLLGLLSSSGEDELLVSTKFSINARSTVVKGWDFASLNPNELDDHLKNDPFSSSTNGKYTFFVIENEKKTKLEDFKCFLGKFRHFWIEGSIDESSLKSIGKVIEQEVLGNLINTREETALEKKSSEQMTVVKSYPNYRLSFYLMNGDPSRVVNWDIENIFRDSVELFLEKIGSLAEFEIDSQVHHYVDLMSKPLVHPASGSFYFTQGTLPSFLDQNQWKFDFTSTTQPTLNFVIYTPRKDQTPLRILNDEVGKEGTFASSSSFTIPQFGSITIHNLNNSTKTEAVMLKYGDLEKEIEVWVSQLRSLLGVRDVRVPKKNAEVLYENSNGITDWELDLVIRRRTIENLASSVETLQSLSNLISNLTNMVVLDNIQLLVESSIDSVNKGYEEFLKGNYEVSFEYSKKALETSEKAFFDPNMLSLLYFPDEHKYAIYLPVFFPLFMQLFSAVYSEVKKSMKKSKERKLKKVKRD